MDQIQQPADFDLEIKEYFGSIEDAFESAIKSQKENSGSLLDGVIIFFVVSAFLSIVPVIPALVWLLLRWLIQTKYVPIFGRQLPIGSFWFWYLALAAFSILGAGLLIYIDHRRSKNNGEEPLDAAPMRFALCYAIVQELDRYSKNRIAKHINQAIDYWPSLRTSLVSFLNPLYIRSGNTAVRPGIAITSFTASDLDAEIMADMRAHGFLEAGYSRYHSLFPQIDILRMSHPWFRLDANTLSIITAFNFLPVKVTVARLREKKDLPAISEILKQLAGYLYSAIPEIANTERHEPEELSSFGQERLTRFAELVQQLPSYSVEPRQLAPKERATKKFLDSALWLLRLFSHENLLVKFASWWVFTQLFVLVILRVTQQWFPSLKLDSTLVSLVIGTPLVVSAAALAAPLRRK